MKIALVGAVESTRVALESMARAGRPPVAVASLPLSKAARHSDFVDLRPAASACGAPVIDIADINAAEAVAALGAARPDILLVIGWSQICGPAVLRLPVRAAIGFHPSLLPENRGRGVIPWTILQRRRETGATLFWMNEGVDTGDILMQERFPVDPAETAATLYRKHLSALDRMIAAALDVLERNTAARRPQDHSRATWCARRVPDDGWLDWNRPADDLWTLVRASGAPYPGAFTYWHGRKATLWDAELVDDPRFWGVPGQVQAVGDDGVLVQCGDRRHLRLKEVQLADDVKKPASGVLRLHDRFDRRCP